MSNIQDPEAFALLNREGTQTGWEDQGGTNKYQCNDTAFALKIYI